ncbi:ISAon1 family transposase N-terminal region protein, partial [Mangrovibacterium marinum]
FPLRDKPLFLHIRRRRWLVESTELVVSRNWNTVAQGTRMTSGFATFLKGILGFIPDQQ